jgi:outer membrane protein TolC
MEGWLVMAESSFKAGRGTLTDIADARSRRDIARARQTEANIKLGEAARSFLVVTDLAADGIPELNPRLLDPDRILLDQKEQWLQRIEENSPEIQSLRMQLEAAQSAVAQMCGGHLPTVDLVASHRKSLNDTDTSVSNPAEYTTRYVGVQVNIPLVSGGGVIAQTSQALAREEKIRQSLESVRRKTLAEADTLFQTIRQGSELVKALSQAVLSAEQAVHGANKGVEAGTRTLVDVLDAERRLYESLSDHATAIYTLANSRFKFLALSGAIDPESIRTTSTWLAAARH